MCTDFGTQMAPRCLCRTPFGGHFELTCPLLASNVGHIFLWLTFGTQILELLVEVGSVS